MRLRWQNKRCTADGLRLMEDAVRKVEEKLRLQASGGPVDEKLHHIPTAINDELYHHCMCVVVAPNASEGCCFRGMECTQYDINNRVYNIGIVLLRNVSDTAIVDPIPILEKTGVMENGQRAGPGAAVNGAVARENPTEQNSSENVNTAPLASVGLEEAGGTTSASQPSEQSEA